MNNWELCKKVSLAQQMVLTTSQWSFLGCQNSDSASSSKLHHLTLLALLVELVSYSSNFQQWPLLALLVVLVLHEGESMAFIFAILYMIIATSPTLCSKQQTSILELNNRNECVSWSLLAAVINLDHHDKGGLIVSGNEAMPWCITAT